MLRIKGLRDEGISRDLTKNLAALGAGLGLGATYSRKASAKNEAQSDDAMPAFRLSEGDFQEAVQSLRARFKDARERRNEKKNEDTRDDSEISERGLPDQDLSEEIILTSIDATVNLVNGGFQTNVFTVPGSTSQGLQAPAPASQSLEEQTATTAASEPQTFSTLLLPPKNLLPMVEKFGLAMTSVATGLTIEQIQNFLDQMILDGTITNTQGAGLKYNLPASAGSSLAPEVLDNGMVIIEASSTDGDVQGLLADLELLGLENGAAAGNLVGGMLPVTSLALASGIANLQHARGVASTTNVGSVTSGGDVAQRSDDARTNFTVDGTGQTVGILSDSFNNLSGAAAGVASGDLPAGVLVVQDLASGGTDEGRAMAEIVADVAPGAAIQFHTATNAGQAGFATAIQALANAGSTVIVDDIGFFAEPFFQDGVITQAADGVVAQGIPYLSAAANNGTKSWEGTFSSAGVVGLDSANRLTNVVADFAINLGEAHDFDTGAGVDVRQSITLEPGGNFLPVFQWDEPFNSVSAGNGAVSDYDIFLFNQATGVFIAASSQDNLTTGDPVEILNFQNTTGAALNLDVVITRFAGTTNNFLKYVNFGNGTTVNEFDTQSPTSVGHANARDGQGVGAAFYALTDDGEDLFGLDFPDPQLESFSSRGGVPIFFDTDGNRLATPEIRQGVDFTAPDGGNTTFFGTSDPEGDTFLNFFGTSAAAPHAAAAVALLKQANPGATPHEIFNAFTSTAIDITLIQDDSTPSNFNAPSTIPGGGVGVDDFSGAGLIDVNAAMAALTTDVLITEIMYDPASAEDDWEWVEIYNSGTATIDLTGWVVDDNFGALLGAANIAAGTVAPGQSAVLFNADDVTKVDFERAWGLDINLIEVTNWSAVDLSNTGETIGLWTTFADYNVAGENVSQSNAIRSQAYTNAAPFPVNNDSASIFLNDLMADPTLGASWSLSTDGGVTPVNTGYTSQARAINTGNDIGSQGSGRITPVINEIVIRHDPVLGTTNNRQFVEVLGSANADYSDFFLVEVEADAAFAGQLDDAIQLGTTNADGYFLIEQNFEPGSSTFLLVTGFTGTVQNGGTAGEDIDTDNDGAFDAEPWSQIYDSIAQLDGDAGDIAYSNVVLDANFDGDPAQPGGASRIPDGTDTDTIDDWVRNDFGGLGLADAVDTPTAGQALNTPGAANALTPELTVTLTEASISENGGTSAGTVTLNVAAVGDRTVTLASDDTGEATVPASVTILDGQTSANFTLTAVDDAVIDGTQTVTVMASLAGAISDTDTIDITDDEPVPFIVTTTADEAAGTTDLLTELLDGTGLSLREAIAIAEAGDADGVNGDADIITFAAGVGEAFNGGGTITLGSDMTKITSEIAIEGAGNVTIDGVDSHQVFTIDSGGIGTFSDLVVTNGSGSTFSSTTAGGGFRVSGAGSRLELDGVSITSGTAGLAAGVLVSSNAIANIVDSTISDNTATTNSGGGIALLFGATANVFNSTIADNTATQFGGGIFVDGNLTLVNSSVVGNTAVSGGGLLNSISTVTVANSTFTGNRSTVNPGGGIHSTGTVNLSNSLITGNDGGGTSSTEKELFVAAAGTLNDLGGNLVDTAVADVFEVVVTVDPNGVPSSGDEFDAGGLADNGGPVQTVALKADLSNPAVDAGTAALVADAQDLDGDTDTAEDLPVDARGANRVQGVASDVGAYESSQVAGIVINEFITDSANDDLDFVELFAAPFTDFSDLTLLEIEGNVGNNFGEILSATTFANADAAGFSTTTPGAMNFDDDNVTFLLVRSFTGAVGNDVDVGNLGSIDNPLWSEIVDDVAVRNGNGAFYSTSVLFLADTVADFISNKGASRIPNGFDSNNRTDWVANDTSAGTIGGQAGSAQKGFAENTPGAANTFNPIDVTVNDVTVVEGDASTSVATVSITLNEAIAGGMVVQPFSFSGTATPQLIPGFPGDYQTPNTNLTFVGNAGETQSFNVTIVGDTDVEPDETIEIALGIASGGGLTDNDVVITIQNDDQPPLMVTTVDDEDAQTTDLATEFLDGNGLSLREAIAIANAGDGNGPNANMKTITFDPTIFAANATITLGSELLVTSLLTIEGDADNDGDMDVTLDGNNATNIFEVNFALGNSPTADLTLNDLTLQNGSSTFGGAVQVFDAASFLSVNDSVFQNNNASMDGGAISSSFGLVSVDRTTFTNNTAGDDGGAIAASGFGAITIVTDSVFNMNVANDSGGAIDDFDGGLTVRGVTLDGNTATTGSGGGINVGAGTVSEIRDSTFMGNTAGSDGGAVASAANLTFVTTTISGNSTTGNDAEGGGVYGTGTVTAVSTTISGNSTAGTNSEGGGIYADGNVSLTNTTVADNFTVGAQSDGGGIFSPSAVTASQSTITGNSTAGTGAGGGGIQGGSVSLTNSIVLGNETTNSTNQEDIGINPVIVPFVITNGLNIIGTGNDTDPSDGRINADPVEVFDQTQTLVDGSGTVSNVISGVLADNGGPVQTVALLASLTNPAIDTGTGALPQDTFDLDDNNNVSNPLPLDAREFARSVNIPGIGTASPDLGAFETQTIATPGPDISTGTALADNQAPADGNDLILGTANADVINGGDGIDTVDYSGSAARVLVFLSGGGTAGDALGDTYNSVENVIGTSGVDLLYGDGAVNRIDGRGEDDALAGFANDDILIGNGGNDVLQGGPGTDELWGETPEGGVAELDVFYIQTGNEIDIIKDWTIDDLLLFRQITGVTERNDLTIVDTGDDVEITVTPDVGRPDPNFRIIIEGIEIADLGVGEDNFIFA